MSLEGTQAVVSSVEQLQGCCRINAVWVPVVVKRDPKTASSSNDVPECEEVHLRLKFTVGGGRKHLSECVLGLQLKQTRYFISET